eukprot:NODE_9_length_64580_cov_1.431941.p40 type:complete len:198 gc:universal NODE_9_length_64580_cov_1.431941:9442-8849(-)
MIILIIAVFAAVLDDENIHHHNKVNNVNYGQDKAKYTNFKSGHNHKNHRHHHHAIHATDSHRRIHYGHIPHYIHHHKIDNVNHGLNSNFKKKYSQRSPYFHELYQQISPNYPNYYAPPSSGASQSDIDKMLAVHQQVRGRPIRWNSNIARLAQMHASGCPSGHANLPRGASGQNMAWTSTYEDSAKMWASEGLFYLI